MLVRPRAVGTRTVVWEAIHLELERRCALKIFDTSGTVPLARAADVRATAQLDHPHIARIHDVFAVHCDDIYVFAMPLLEGEALHRVVAARGRLAMARIAPLLAQLLEALDYARSVGVAFPNAGSGQLFVTGAEKREDVKLLGFGRPIPGDVRGIDEAIEASIVRAVWMVLRECVAQAPPLVERLLFNHREAQPSLAETRRLLAVLTNGGKTGR